MNLLNGCRYEAQFVKSALYVRLVTVLHLFTAYMTMTSGLALSAKIVFAGILTVLQWQAYMHGCPQPQLQTLKRQEDQWHLFYADGAEQTFSDCRIVLDTGFFFVLQLRQAKKQKRFLMFRDQLENEAYHRLYVLQKVR